jgi:hypothetical protein
LPAPTDDLASSVSAAPLHTSLDLMMLLGPPLATRKRSRSTIDGTPDFALETPYVQRSGSPQLLCEQTPSPSATKRQARRDVAVDATAAEATPPAGPAQAGQPRSDGHRLFKAPAPKPKPKYFLSRTAQPLHKGACRHARSASVRATMTTRRADRERMLVWM